MLNSPSPGVSPLTPVKKLPVLLGFIKPFEFSSKAAYHNKDTSSPLTSSCPT